MRPGDKLLIRTWCKPGKHRSVGVARLLWELLQMVMGHMVDITVQHCSLEWHNRGCRYCDWEPSSLSEQGPREGEKLLRVGGWLGLDLGLGALGRELC